MADMFTLRDEDGACSPTIVITDHSIAEANPAGLHTSDEATNMTHTGDYQDSTLHADIKDKLKYVRDHQRQFRQAAGRTTMNIDALKQKMVSVQTEADQHLTNEINDLEDYLSEVEGGTPTPINSVRRKDTVSLPVFVRTLENVDSNLKHITDTFRILVRRESIISGPLRSLKKDCDIRMGFGVRGITHDPNRQQLVVRTTDETNPLKLYNYGGHCIAEIGKNFPELADQGLYRGLCVDTKRDTIVATSSGRALVLGLDGSFRGEVKVGSNLIAAAYSEELDVYAVSDWDENKVYIIDPTSFQVTASFGSRGAGDQQFDGPFSLCFGAVRESAKVCLIVGDFHNHCLKLFDIDGRHRETLGGHGCSLGEFRGPSSVAGDVDGKVITCDLHNQRLVSFWADDSGVQWQELLTSEDLDYRQPAMVCVDSAARMLALGYAGVNEIKVFQG